MITKVTLTMDDGSTHDFLSMDDAVAHANMVAAPAPEPTPEVTPEPEPTPEVTPEPEPAPAE